jgi:chromosome partitioning protein
MRRIAVVNQTGGTGKTTTVGNLAAGLALSGRRVLMVDFDPQGALSIWYDVRSAVGLYEVLRRGLDPGRCVCKVRENLFLLPGDRRLSEIHERVDPARWSGIERGVASVERFDYVVMDCPPSWSRMSRFAVTVSDEVYMPVSMDYLSMIGARQVVEGAGDLVDEEGVVPEIRLVIPTMVDRRQKKSREILKVLRWHFGSRVTDPIRSNVRLSEAISYHQSIYEYAPESNGAKDYGKLVRRVEHVEKSQSDGGRPSREHPGPPAGPGEQEDIFGAG